jgi:hypothetical protein
MLEYILYYRAGPVIEAAALLNQIRQLPDSHSSALKKCRVDFLSLSSSRNLSVQPDYFQICLNASFINRLCVVEAIVATLNTSQNFPEDGGIVSDENQTVFLRLCTRLQCYVRRPTDGARYCTLW